MKSERKAQSFSEVRGHTVCSASHPALWWVRGVPTGVLFDSSNSILMEGWVALSNLGAGVSQARWRNRRHSSRTWPWGGQSGNPSREPTTLSRRKTLSCYMMPDSWLSPSWDLAHVLPLKQTAPAASYYFFKSSSPQIPQTANSTWDEDTEVSDIMKVACGRPGQDLPPGPPQVTASGRLGCLTNVSTTTTLCSTLMGPESPPSRC